MFTPRKQLSKEELQDLWNELAKWSQNACAAALSRNHDYLYRALGELDYLRARLQNHEKAKAILSSGYEESKQ